MSQAEAEVKRISPFKPGFVARGDSPFLGFIAEASVAPKGKFRLMSICCKKLSGQIIRFAIIDDVDTLEQAQKKMPLLPEFDEKYAVYDDQGSRRLLLA